MFDRHLWQQQSTARAFGDHQPMPSDLNLVGTDGLED